MKKRVLVTGGAGFIGSHCCIELLNSNHEILVFDNLSNSHAVTIESMMQIAGKTFKFYKGDLLEQSALEEVFRNFSPDAVIHFAGLKSVAESVANPIEYYTVNVCSTLNLLRTMELFSCKCIIFSSSATVYGRPEKLPVSENAPLNPINPYGNSKYIIEKILKDWVKSDEERIATSLRYFNPIGAHESGKIGEISKTAPNNIMPIICEVAKGKRDKFLIFGDSYNTRDGSGERDYVHVVDVAKAHLAALEKEIIGFSAFNIGRGVGTTVKELLMTFEKVNNLKIPSQVTSNRPGDHSQIYASCLLANQELKVRCELDLEQMCVDAWKWASGND